MDDGGVGTLVAFATRLRQHGLAVGTERALAFSRAAAALGPRDPADLYWAGRVTLVARRDDLAVYDRAFAEHFAGVPGATVDAPVRPVAAVVSDTPEEAASGGDETPAAGTVVTAATRRETLRQKAFEDYTDEERRQTRQLIARLGAATPRRPSRRTRPARRGRRPDIPLTLRRSFRTYGEPVERLWRVRRPKPRRLVWVLDVSGSMGPYARTLAQFAHAAVRAGGLVEAFAFGTRLTRITPALRNRDPDAALAALGRAVPDWQGGTRIGDCVGELIDEWARRGPLRGAIVVVCSDGLERGDPEVLARHMRRLHRIARRVVWVNPLKGSPRYEPIARGMAAALPHVDDFLAGHSLAGLEALAAVVSELER